ncbi:UDP-2-acetamido-2,6-beta-L-arabino-hexul-4-ose reductase [Robiginitalea myxolifaciens]|uniref:UDP-2-acetamido-2,6-beta-L-arabino-hexul-4-ose reductase n=1 Tax=Robiginitalea myxolifaciens TaxID=400055 RepID=A0A1I6H1X9_9FLAO|nr:NAD-dependent epimerase/dehydratase family protein [Robiginitalea myxolifaciens]SFR48443.1 UDP-2-acetamido-2,6-beta-L-arabino-hexul-4-ose reductase [Robiginitalea myxolifaciens]
MKIGITGQHGFVGSHLANTLALDESLELIPFQRDYFEDSEKLQAFVAACDAVVHLAAMNRHPDPEVIYATNVALVEKLIAACKAADHTPHILFASSTQESKENRYGESKLAGKELFKQWSEETNGRCTSLTIPNVFGPFGKPNYNSVVATFCHKIAHGEAVEVHQDNEIGLIYVNELVCEIIEAMGLIPKAFPSPITATETASETGKGAENTSASFRTHAIAPRHFYKVTEILNLLLQFRSDYMENGEFPDVEDTFTRALFNTFRCYIPTDHYPAPFTLHTDPRGSFVEIARTGSKGQFSYSTTVPGITRGNHFHTRKAERFAVIKGKAQIQLRKIGTDEVITYELSGEAPAYVDMPVWYTHNISNVGQEELITLFWINEPYNPEDPDTFFVDVVQKD